MAEHDHHALGNRRASAKGRQRVTRRSALHLALLTATSSAVSLASGCALAAGERSSAPAGPQSVSGQITWLMRSQASELAWEQAALGAFKQEVPAVTVNLETVATAAEFDPKLTALLAGGTPPDVWTHWGQSGFGDYFARGQLSELSVYVGRDKLDGSTFLPNTFDAWKRGGKLMGLSFNQRFGTFIFYNKQLLQQAGVPLPPVDWEDKSWTWEKMVAAARQLTGGEGATRVFGIAAGDQPGLWGLSYLFGGDFFTKEHYATGLAKRSAIGSPEVQAAMTARADLMHKLRVYPTPADASSLGGGSHTQQFIAGRLAMLLETGASWPNIDQNARFEWGVAAAPRQKDNRIINFVNPLLLAKDSKNKEAGWSFIKWNVSEPGQRVLVQNAFQPVHKGLLDEWLKAGRFSQAAADVKKVVEGAAPHGQISPNQLFVDFAAVRREVDESLAPVWRGEKAPADALRDARTRVDSVLSEVAARYGKQ